MDVSALSRKEIGDLGEREVIAYLKRQGFSLVARNIARKTGEIDVLMEKNDIWHFIEVKTITCVDFPDLDGSADSYDPSENLHEAKIRRVARTAEWLVAEKDWQGDWQVDGTLVWLRLVDGAPRVLHLPQIL